MVSVLTLKTASASCTRARERVVNDSSFVCSYLDRSYSVCLNLYLLFVLPMQVLPLQREGRSAHGH